MRIGRHTRRIRLQKIARSTAGPPLRPRIYRIVTIRGPHTQRVLRVVLVLGAVLGACAAGTSPAATPSAGTPLARHAPLPLFDAHIHYSEPAWSILTPQQAIARLREAGVVRAIVSSSPDEGTLKLHEAAPDMVVPFLRPYRGEIGPSAWARDGTTVAYVRSRYRPGLHRGIGEIHLSAGDVDLPVVRQVVEFAVAEKLWLQIHTDARGIEEVMRGPASGTRVLWAHAGQFATPAEIARLLERYPQMWVELAGRSDIGTADGIDGAWRDLFLRFPDRFMAGSDTWINAQWERLVDIERSNQAWLAQLPPDLARRIASGTAEALFPLSR